MGKYRYIITGGDNGYCAKCGGLCDRALLRIDDDCKVYKQYYRAPSCLGKHCWKRQELYGGVVIARGVVENGKLLYNLLQPEKNKIYIIENNGDETVFVKVTVKNNKYGKDGEFGDKLDTYTYEGTVEPKDIIAYWQAKARERCMDVA